MHVSDSVALRQKRDSRSAAEPGDGVSTAQSSAESPSGQSTPSSGQQATAPKTAPHQELLAAGDHSQNRQLEAERFKEASEERRSDDDEANTGMAGKIFKLGRSLKTVVVAQISPGDLELTWCPAVPITRYIEVWLVAMKFLLDIFLL